MWDYINKKCVNLLLFTTAGTPNLQSDLVADFKQPDGFNASYLDHGIDGEGVNLHFITGGEVSGNLWIADAAQAHGDTYSAYANINAQFEGSSFLSLQINVTTAESTLTAWYMFDNRGSGTRIPGFAFNELTNKPNVDNTLSLLINGKSVSCTIDGTPYDSSVIDNFSVPGDNPLDSESFYLTWKEISAPLPAGTVKIDWKLHRAVTDDFGRLDAWVDDIALPEVMIGNDVTGENRYYFDGERVRSADLWSWAIRNDENGDDISRRVRTVPDYITMDKVGRIAYGNPHYYFVTIAGQPDTTYGGPRFGNSHDGKREGCVRFTASPNANATIEPPCYDPDAGVFTFDPIDDPRWGSFETLTPNDYFQIRGANGRLRDATEMPIPLRRFMYTKTDPENFASYIKSGGYWSMRAHGWTIKDDGQRRIPHCQVIWRPTFAQPAHPEAEWPSPPYSSHFATSDLTDVTKWGYSAMRVNDDRFIAKDSEQPRYSRTNLVIQSHYCDALSRQPQLTWGRITGDPSEDQEGYWLPDDPSFPDGIGLGPWPSANWTLLMARFWPTCMGFMRVVPPLSNDTLCPVEVDGDPVDVHAPMVRLVVGIVAKASTIIPFPDFDACECNCDCCGPHGTESDLTSLVL